MLSRSETIMQALSGVTPQEESDVPVSFLGPVSQVNIINHATIHIGSVQIVVDGEILNMKNCPRPKSRKRKGRTAKAIRLRPWPEHP